MKVNVFLRENETSNVQYERDIEELQKTCTKHEFVVDYSDVEGDYPLLSVYDDNENLIDIWEYTWNKTDIYYWLWGMA